MYGKVEKYKKYFKLISQKDDGIYDAMNKGIELSNGKSIGFINSDDFYIDNSIIENILNKFKSNNRNLIQKLTVKKVIKIILNLT